MPLTYIAQSVIHTFEFCNNIYDEYLLLLGNQFSLTLVSLQHRPSFSMEGLISLYLGFFIQYT